MEKMSKEEFEKLPKSERGSVMKIVDIEDMEKEETVLFRDGKMYLIESDCYDSYMEEIEEIYDKAHAASDRNRKQLEDSKICGCFCCGRIFDPAIIDWSYAGDDYKNTVGFCPFCDMDSLLGDASGFPITPEFISEMQRIFFGSPFDEACREYVDKRINGEDDIIFEEDFLDD